jgi:hypothetical protein
MSLTTRLLHVAISSLEGLVGNSEPFETRQSFCLHTGKQVECLGAQQVHPIYAKVGNCTGDIRKSVLDFKTWLEDTSREESQ